MTEESIEPLLLSDKVVTDGNVESAHELSRTDHEAGSRDQNSSHGYQA